MTNISLTTRIVVAIVILSLGIIFIPLLLETDKIDTSNMDVSPIPDIPSEISTIVFQLNDETGNFEETIADKVESPVAKFENEVAKIIENSADEVEQAVPVPDVIPVAAAEKPQTVVKTVVIKPKTTAPKSNAVRHSWVLQLASFKSHEKALKLRDKLRSMQYVTYIDGSKRGGNRRWRVRIGPDLGKSKIEKFQSVLNKKLGLPGLIVQRR